MRVSIHKTLGFCMLMLSANLSFANDLELGIFQLNRGEYQAAIAEFQPLVDDNYAPGQYQMALVYLNGYGVTKDPKKAVKLLELAAEQKYAAALFDLGVMYTEGKYVTKDLTKAFKFTEKAANEDMASAQFNLGVMYYGGDGVTQDYHQASKWYKKAAEQNYALAQFNLALMYFEGKGVPKDIKMSYVWNILAARGNYLPAEKSRAMDEHKLSTADIQSAREMADNIYAKITAKIEREAKAAEKKNRLNTY